MTLAHSVSVGRGLGAPRRARSALLMLALAPACRHPDPAPSREPQSSASATSAATPSLPSGPDAALAAAKEPSREPPPKPGLEPLSGSEFVPLEVPGFQPAVVSVPIGTTTPRPIAVAVHGNFDRPEWQCEVFRGLIGSRGFLLCPRGVARRDVPRAADRWEYISGPTFKKELEAGLQSLSDRFGAHVAPGAVVFIGFSLGAIYGAPLVQSAPERYPRAVFIEGGLNAWTPHTAKKFAAGGGQRLFIACGQADCLNRAKRLAPQFERAGLPTRTGGHPKAGHTYDGPVAAAVAEHFEWLVEGDPRWGG